MRKGLLLTLVTASLLALAPSLRADDRADALAIVDDAIKAHGGADALTKTQSLTRKGTGTFTLDKPTDFTDVVTVHLPDKVRLEVKAAGGVNLLVILNGDKAWESTNGGPGMPATILRIKELRDEAYVEWLTTLVPLKKDGVTLKPLPANKGTVGIAVSSKDRPDVKMYFDKDSRLLVKIERDAVQAGVKIGKEYQFADYKEVDGAKLPTKLTELVNDKKFSEITAEYRLHKPDDAAFAPP
jgi:hypothetical protein